MWGRSKQLYLSFFKSLLVIFLLSCSSMVYAGSPLPASTTAFRNAVTACLLEAPVDGLCTNYGQSSGYGVMPDWDTSQVTNMSASFSSKTQFNGDISAWDTSSVTDMSYMFTYARAFNQDISSWDVSNVRAMNNMFLNAIAFNQDLSGWNVSNVTNMKYMFTYARSFNQDIRAWSVNPSASFFRMFFGATLMNAAPYNAPANRANVAWFTVPDTTAPTLNGVSISSVNSTSSKAVPNDVVSLTFTASETISSPTVTFSSGGASVNGAVTVQNISANTWTASYTTNANDTAGPVTFEISFRDTAGNVGTVVTATNDSSSVAVVIDSDLPTLLSSSPSNGSKSVKLDQNIILKFSEDVIAGSGQIKLFDNNDKLVEAFAVSSSVISGSTVTLNPSADLASLSAYYVQIPSTAFVDAAGNAYLGISNKTSLNFITLDVNAPTLISSIPSDNASSVKLDKNIILTFSENITAGSGKISLFEENGKLVEAFAVSSSIISGATVTLNPTKDLKPENSYYIQIPSTALIDAAGNKYAGINNKTDINFTTRKKTPKEAFTEVKDEIGTDMKANTTKQIRSFATATTAVVTAARSRVLSKRVNSSSSRSSNRSSGPSRSTGGGGGSGSGATGSSGSGGSTSGTSSDGVNGENSGGTDRDTESSFDLRSSTRGTNASGQINSVVSSYDGKVTRYSETQFSYTKSENDAEAGSASSQIIFEREKSQDLTVGHFIGFSVSKNSTVGTKSTDIESVGVQFGVYFVENITEDLFVDGYIAGSLLTNKMEVTTATMVAEADYVSRMGAAGAAVTGSIDVARWEILPTLALDYSSVSSQDASFEVTFGGGNSNELSSPGNVKQLSLTFSPDFRTAFDYYDGYWAQGSTLSFKPKITCQRVNQDTITRECGQGAALSLITQDEDAMQTLSFTLGVDKISSDTTYSANALYKFEF